MSFYSSVFNWNTRLQCRATSCASIKQKLLEGREPLWEVSATPAPLANNCPRRKSLCREDDPVLVKIRPTPFYTFSGVCEDFFPPNFMLIRSTEILTQVSSISFVDTIPQLQEALGMN